MAETNKAGTDWTDEELDLIVAAYFAMLTDELAGRPYVKAQHRAALVQLIGRSQGSVEFKHQNISAVLEELGLPWIIGYKPARNFQNALFGAIERHLSGNRDDLYRQAPAKVLHVAEPQAVFVLCQAQPKSRRLDPRAWSGLLTSSIRLNGISATGHSAKAARSLCSIWSANA